MAKKGLVSITTLINQLDKPALKIWANGIGLKGIKLNEYYSETAEAGRIAHQYILSLLGGPTPTTKYILGSAVGLHVMRMISKFKTWLDGKPFGAHFVEQELESIDGYHGRIDWAGVLDGQRTLLDVKSADEVYSDSYLQLSAYRDLLRENGWPVERVGVLLVPRDKESMPVRLIEIPVDLLDAGSQSIQDLLCLYHTMKPLRAFFTERDAQKKKEKKEAA